MLGQGARVVIEIQKPSEKLRGYKRLNRNSSSLLALEILKVEVGLLRR